MENRSPNDRGDFIMENIDNDKLLDDIIAFLDGSAAKGAGHLGVEVNQSAGSSISRTVDTGCMDCAKGNIACKIPTIDDAIDETIRKEK